MPQAADSACARRISSARTPASNRTLPHDAEPASAAGYSIGTVSAAASSRRMSGATASAPRSDITIV